MKNLVLTLILIAYYDSLIGQQNASIAIACISNQKVICANALEKLKAQLIGLDSFQSSSASEYYKFATIVFDSLAQDIENKLRQQRLSRINNCLHKLFDSDDNNSFTDIESFESAVNNTDKELSNLIDLLRKISASFRFYERTQSRVGFLPIKNRYDAYVYDQKKGKVSQSKFLNHTKISLSPEDRQYSVFSEVYADYFSFVKFSLGSVVTFGQIDEIRTIGNKENGDSLYVAPSTSAINKLVSGGGNLVFNISYPICIYINDKSNFRYTSTLQNRIAMDVPFNNTTLKGYPINVEPSLVNSFYLGGMNEVLAITLDVKIARIFGNDRFYNLLGRQCSGSFLLNQFSLGVQVNKKFNLGINFYIGDSYVKQNFPSTLALGFLF